MLYEFHKTQNSKKPNSLHATYLLTGRRLVQQDQSQVSDEQQMDGEDSHMRSSPLPASSAPETQESGQPEFSSMKVVMLVKQEELEGESLFSMVFIFPGC